MPVVRYNERRLITLVKNSMFRFFRRKKTEPVAMLENQEPDVLTPPAPEVVVSEPCPMAKEGLLASDSDTNEVVANKPDQVLDLDMDLGNPNATDTASEVWMAAQTKIEPAPIDQEEANANALPPPDEDGKIRLRFILGESGISGISDEELEAAALAEIPEDSPERYRQETPEEDDEDCYPEAEVDTEVETATKQALSDLKFKDTAVTLELSHETGQDTIGMVSQDVVLSATSATEKNSWLSRLKRGLARTGSNISAIFVGVKVDEDLFEELETALIMADTGVEATQSLLTKLRAKVKRDRIESAPEVKKALHILLSEHLRPLEKTFMLAQDATNVVMIAGVNGAGKTTSIGKLTHHFQASGASVLLAAGDTFRAAAREQLIAWGSRNNVQVIAQEGGDPAAVAFDAVNAGRARRNNVVMVDTAGRLPTQLHLMEELKKIRRVINKADSSAPHEVLLVVDGNTGQNAIAQIRAFDAVLGLTGLVVTKLDGTAKGGILAAVAAGSQGVRPIPVYWIGVGEGLHDLQPFVASEFVSALLGD